jgi:hypothetical protein
MIDLDRATMMDLYDKAPRGSSLKKTLRAALLVEDDPKESVFSFIAIPKSNFIRVLSLFVKATGWAIKDAKARLETAAIGHPNQKTTLVSCRIIRPEAMLKTLKALECQVVLYVDYVLYRADSEDKVIEESA